MKWQIDIPFDISDIERFIEARKIYENGSVEGPFLLTANDVITALTTLSVDATLASGYYQLPMIPKGTIYSTHNKNASVFRLLIAFEPRVHMIKYTGYSTTEKPYFIEMPHALMDLTVLLTTHKKWRVQSSSMYALQKGDVTEDSLIYKYPFPHVNKGDARICWGINALPEYEKLSEMSKFYDLFLDSPFGEDYGLALLSGETNFHKYLQTQEEKPFNDDDLMPTGKTIRNLIENF